MGETINKYKKDMLPKALMPISMILVYTINLTGGFNV